jgi:hypothetical protein
MSEAFWLNVATTLGVPTAVMGAAVVGYYKLSQQQLDRGETREKLIRDESKVREDTVRLDSQRREDSMRETIREYSVSVDKLNTTMDAVNANLIRVYNNLGRNNRIMEELMANNNIKIIESGVSENDISSAKKN